MPVPRLNHPLACVIEPADKRATPTRESREPVRTVRRKAQVRINGQNTVGAPPMRLDPPGLRADSTGNLLVIRRECEARGYAPDAGDRIRQIGRDAVDFYVQSVEPTAHYPDQGGATMFRLYYGRRP